MDLKDLLKDKLSKNELEILRKSFDVIGDVAVLEIPDELRKKERMVAEAVLEVCPYIKTVCKKLGGRKGKLRLRKIGVIGARGKRKPTETIHKEYGYKIKLDVASVYFSPREGTERQRIASLVKPVETILLMFAGAGPYAVAICKRQPAVKVVYAVEMNRVACEYMEENVKLNGMNYKIIPICGDVKKILPKLNMKFDRIIMPLPLEGYRYIPVALKQLKPKGVVHFYYVSPKNMLFSKPEKIIKKECRKAGRKFRILKRQEVLPYGPNTRKICIDFQVF
jgi:tRNA (guanine37-N1)-methyltransferase